MNNNDSASSSAPALPLVPFLIPRHPGPISLSQARVDLPPEEFRRRLRAALLDHPGLTLAQVGRELGISRQRVAALAGKLGRPSCADPARPRRSPKTDLAREGLPDLADRVRAGQSLPAAARALGLSLPVVEKLGFKVREVRPSLHDPARAHGTRARAREGCGCWRCRRAAGATGRRRARTTPALAAQIADWLAWRDPKTGRGLSQAEVGRLAGVGQMVVSRIARSEKK